MMACIHENKWNILQRGLIQHSQLVSESQQSVFHLAGNLASRPAQLALQTVTGDFASWLCDADFDATIRTPISLRLADTQLPGRWAKSRSMSKLDSSPFIVLLILLATYQKQESRSSKPVPSHQPGKTPKTDPENHLPAHAKGCRNGTP